MCNFQAVASITAHGRFLSRNSCTCSQYAVIKIRINYIPRYSWMAFSHNVDIKNFCQNCTQPALLFSLTYYGSWISGSVCATTADYNYNYNILLNQTETGRAVAVSLYITQLQTRNARLNNNRNYNFVSECLSFQSG
jgi:hypothetical protein